MSPQDKLRLQIEAYEMATAEKKKDKAFRTVIQREIEDAARDLGYRLKPYIEAESCYEIYKGGEPVDETDWYPDLCAAALDAAARLLNDN